MINASPHEVSRMLVEALPLHHTQHVPGSTKSIKFLFFTDVHTQSIAPEGRHDVYFASICGKLAWLNDLCRDEGVAFRVCGGDFSNSVASGANLRPHTAFVASLLNEIEAPTYFNIGNHDYHGNMDYIFDSPAGEYIASGALRPFTSLEVKFASGQTTVLAAIPYISPKETTSLFHKSALEYMGVLHDRRDAEGHTLLLFTHQLVKDGKDEDLGVDLQALADLRPRMILNGHDHRNLGEFTRAGLRFVQPGAVARYHNSSEEHTRRPSAALVTLHDTGEVEWRPVVIPHEEADKVFYTLAKELRTTLEETVEASRELASRVFVTNLKGDMRTRILSGVKEVCRPEVWDLVSRHATRLSGVSQ